MIFPSCDGCGLRLAHHNSEDGKCVACGWLVYRRTPLIEYSSFMFKCVKPMVHRPEFEGSKHCKTCYAQHILKEITSDDNIEDCECVGQYKGVVECGCGEK